MSDEEFCKTDVNPFTGTATSTGWKHGIFTCCNRNRLSWVGNGTMKGRWSRQDVQETTVDYNLV
ncbi:hypothetical protein D6C92_01528 [Aureobasidium pullulans]|nr:hypothetical protein D6C92_01528 [Aureobasidium pullulans]